MGKPNSALDAIRNGGPPGSVAKTADPAASVAAVPDAGETTPPPVALTKPPKDVAKVMLYLHPKVAKKFKEVAFTEDRKAHDVYLEALDLYLTQQGHGGLKGVTER